MKTLFFAVLVIAMVCGYMDVKTPTLPPMRIGEGTTTDGHVVSVANIQAALVAAQKEHDAAAVKIVDLKKQLRQAQTVKMQHEFYIAALIFVLLALGCVALSWFKGLIFCGVGIAGACICARLTPYRTWILVGIALAVAVWIAYYLVRHHHKLLQDIVTLEKKV